MEAISNEQRAMKQGNSRNEGDASPSLQFSFVRKHADIRPECKTSNSGTEVNFAVFEVFTALSAACYMLLSACLTLHP
jgi:hypothetical protein